MEEVKENTHIDKRRYILLFLVFIIIMCDPFIDNVLVGVSPSAVMSDRLTVWGIMLQGIFLVILYIIAQHLMFGDVNCN
jgi:hypothetical protein